MNIKKISIVPARPRALALALLGCLVSVGSEARAGVRSTQATQATIDALELYPTIHALGVEVAVTEDAPGEELLRLEYRVAGAADYQPGHRLLPIDVGRYAGSLMFLEPATSYELRVTLGPEGAPVQVLEDSFVTRADGPPAPRGDEIWVDASDGGDGNPGTMAAPTATIQAASALAAPGDIIRVRPGVYRETVTPPTGGSEGAPLWIVADGPGVIIDGSDPEIAAGASWTPEGGPIFSTPFAGSTRYVAADETRLYDYYSLADLEGEAMGLAGGFYVDADAQRLYVALPSGDDPSNHEMHVAVRDAGFLLDTLSHVVIQGFEVRYLGAGEYGGVGVDIRDSGRCWVRENELHHMNTGVRVRRPLAHENVIERNRFRDTSVYGWPWGAVKTFTAEASAISITHGRGNIVRDNVLEGSFNGVYVGAFGDGDEAIARDTDVYRNLMREHGDDGLEPEGAAVNVRMWNNVIRGVKNAISLAPIEVGPTWIVRTLIDGYQDNALKLNNGSTGWIVLYHTTAAPLAGADYPGAQAMTPTIPFGPVLARNNIWHGNRYVIEYGGAALHDGVDLDHDDLWTDDVEAAGRFVKWKDITYADLTELAAADEIEQQGVQHEPSYEDPWGGDYTLVEGHPLVDAALELDGINDRFAVTDGPDIGAFERGGVAPGPAPETGGTDSETETGDPTFGGETDTDDTDAGTAGSSETSGDPETAGTTAGDATGDATSAGSSDDATATGGGSDSSTDPDADADEGCACSSAPGPATPPAALLGALLLARARRRRRRTGSTSAGR